MKKTIYILLVMLTFGLAGCQTTPATESEFPIPDYVEDTLKK